MGRPADFENYNVNVTSSSVYAVKVTGINVPYYNFYGFQGCTGALLSGTWRTMSGAGNDAGDRGFLGLWVRIS